MTYIGIPPQEEWRRAPYFRRVANPLWAIYEAPQDLRFKGDNPLLLEDEADELEGEALPCDCLLRLRIERGDFPYWRRDCLLRLRIERGDFPYCAGQYNSSAQPLAFWPEWVSDVKQKRELRQRLEHLGLYEAFEISAQLILHRSHLCLDSVISHWNSVQHTFVARRGEFFTPTLEDVAEFIRLPIRGERLHDVHHLINVEHEMEKTPWKFHAESAHRGSRWVGEVLPDQPQKISKATYVSWTRLLFRDYDARKKQYVEGDEYDGPYYFAAFLAYF